MSKFFATGESSSSSSDDVAVINVNAAAPRTDRRTFFDSSSSSDSGPREVVSKAQRALESIAEAANNLYANVQADKWTDAANDFTTLTKVVKSNKNVAKKQGLPNSYFKALVAVEDKEEGMSKDDYRSMNKREAKAFTKLTKAVKDNISADVRTALDAWRADPVYEDDFSMVGDDGTPSSTPKISSKSDPADGKKEPVSRKSFWMSDSSDSDSDDGKKRKDKNKDRPRKEKDKVVQEEEKEEIKPEDVRGELKELVAMRGRRGVDIDSFFVTIEELYNISESETEKLEMRLLKVALEFDRNPNLFSFLPTDKWQRAFATFVEILDILDTKPHIYIDSSAEEKFDQPPPRPLVEGQLRVYGNLSALFALFDDDFTKSLRATDPHKSEYIERLGDETPLTDAALRVENYLKRTAEFTEDNNESDLARVALRRVEHVYFKRPDVVVAGAEDNADAEELSPEEADKAIAEATELVKSLCVVVFKWGDPTARARALLYLVYHHSLCGRFFEARDLLLMSHIQDSIGMSSDVELQIVFNRTMVQLGLCAFRCGLISEAHSCFQDICSSGRVKELVAQGLSNSRKASERDFEREKRDRRRLVPYHMHINLEMLECVHLTCAMLLEIPHMAANAHETKQRVISKHFRRFYFDRSPFIGPPESTRDFVISAARKLAEGDVTGCLELLLSLDVWRLLSRSEAVISMLTEKVKIEGLRTYLFTFAQHYDTISQTELAEMFELSEGAVHSVVSKMMISEELHASWDQPTSSIVMHHVEPTRMQFLALQFAEKASAMVENNEKLLEQKTGVGRWNDRYDGRQRGRGRGGRGRGGRGRGRGRRGRGGNRGRRDNNNNSGDY